MYTIIIIISIVILYFIYHNKNNIVCKIIHTNEATQGVFVDNKFIYTLGNSTIGKYNKQTGKKIKIIHTNFKHFNSGTVHNGLLYITHNPKMSNSIVIFTTDLILVKIISIPYSGSLTWINFNNGSWYGCLAYYNKDIQKSRIVKFNSKWKIIKIWKYPKELLNKFYPYSNSGGQFININTLLLTGHDKKELYVTYITDNIIKLVKIIPVTFAGQSFSVNNNIIYGIERKTKNIHITSFHI